MLLATIRTCVRHSMARALTAVRQRISQWTKPVLPTLAAGTITDIVRSRQDLLLENALLRQQVLILRRQTKRPGLTAIDRGLLVLLASRLRTWAQALVIIQPETVLRWQRQGFRLFWRCRSRAACRTPRLPAETAALIRRMAAENRLWGAERIRGELLKLDIRVSKRTIQRYMRQARRPQPPGQTWASFLQHHAREVRVCDFLRLSDLFFRPLFAFFIVELASRRVVHAGVTRTPTDGWVTQQLREATMEEARPRYLICDHDAKYGAHFAQLAAASGIKLLRTPVQAPRANAVIERFLGSVRRECLDHVLIFSEAQVRRVLGAYVAYFNHARPHQGLGQVMPSPQRPVARPAGAKQEIAAYPVLGGLHHEYRRAA